MRKHDAVVRLLYEHTQGHLGFPSLLEQHTAPTTTGHDYDRIDLVVQVSGADTHMDVAMVSPLTAQRDLLKTRAKRDGHAALQTANRKRNRYPELGVLPFPLSLVITDARARNPSDLSAHWLPQTRRPPRAKLPRTSGNASRPLCRDTQHRHQTIRATSHDMNDLLGPGARISTATMGTFRYDA